MDIHIYLFSIDIYIDLIFFFNFIELLRHCCTIFLSLSLILYPLVVFHAQPESRQQKFTNFEWAKEVRLDFSFQACFDFNLVFKAEPYNPSNTHNFVKNHRIFVGDDISLMVLALD